MNGFESKCRILSDLWINFRDDDDFADFIEYNDIGLPLAYILANKIAHASMESTKYIEETWSLLLEALALDESVEWETLEDMLDNAELLSENDEDPSEDDDDGPTDLVAPSHSPSRINIFDKR